MRKRWSYEEIRNIIESDGYSLLSKKDEVVYKFRYVKLKTLLNIKCPNGHIYHATFDVFKRGNRCKICSYEVAANKRKHSYEYIKSYFKKEGYELLSNEYITVDDPLEAICPEQHKWNVSFGNFKSGYRCPICSKNDKNMKLLEDTYDILQRNDYKVISFKENMDGFFTDSIITIECKNGHIVDKSIKNIRNDKGCNICSGKDKKSLDEVIEIFKSEEYSVVSHNGYENNQSRFLLLCKNNHEWNITYANFQQGSRCPLCVDKISKGESKILDYFNNKQIKYIYQYKTDKCGFKQLLPFDFYLPDYNILIEFDGEQHYKIIKHFGGLDKFIDRKIRDTIKTIYCKENNITLIRIPYWDIDNIENILDKELK